MSTNAKKPSSKIEEIFYQLAGKLQNKSQSQSLKDLSPARKKLLALYSKTEEFTNKYIVDTWLKKMVMKIAQPHIKDTIENKMTEEEVKSFLNWVFELLKDDYEQLQVSKELKNPINKELNQQLKKFPRYKELANLL